MIGRERWSLAQLDIEARTFRPDLHVWPVPPLLCLSGSPLSVSSFLSSFLSCDRVSAFGRRLQRLCHDRMSRSFGMQVVCRLCLADDNVSGSDVTTLYIYIYIYIYMYTNQSLTISLDSVVYEFKAQHLPHKSLPSTLTKLTSLLHNADQDRNVSHRSTRISRTSGSKNRSRTYGYECVLRRARLGRRSFRRAR